MHIHLQKTFIAPSHLSRGDQAVTAHTSSVPAPPYPIRAEGPDLWYQMRLEDTMVGLSLAPKSRGARIRECVYVGLVGGGVGGWGWGGWLCSSPRPPRRQHRGGSPVVASDATPGQLRQRDDTAGGGEGRARDRGSSDGVTCTRDDRQQVPCSAGGL